MLFIHTFSSPLGGITLASDGRALTGLWFDGQRHFAETVAGPCRTESLPVFDRADRWLGVYFSGRDPGEPPPLSCSDTPFRLAVWDILRRIPYGQTTTYGEIARLLSEARGGGRMSAQAVGNAVSRNPISLMIPCHRVIGADGSLVGYAGGIDKKRILLQMENAAIGA